MELLIIFFLMAPSWRE